MFYAFRHHINSTNWIWSYVSTLQFDTAMDHCNVLESLWNGTHCTMWSDGNGLGCDILFARGNMAQLSNIPTVVGGGCGISAFNKESMLQHLLSKSRGQMYIPLYRRLGISDEYPILSILDHFLFYDTTGHPLRSQTSSSQATRRSKGLMSSQLSSQGRTCLKPSDPSILRLWEDGKRPISKRGCDITWHGKDVSTLRIVLNCDAHICSLSSLFCCVLWTIWVTWTCSTASTISAVSLFHPAKRSRFPAVSDEKYLQPTCSTRCRPRPAKGHDLPILWLFAQSYWHKAHV